MTTLFWTLKIDILLIWISCGRYAWIFARVSAREKMGMEDGVIMARVIDSAGTKVRYRIREAFEFLQQY